MSEPQRSKQSQTQPQAKPVSQQTAPDRVTELEAALAARETEIQSLIRARDIERALRNAGAIDLETAALLCESQLNQSPGAEVAAMVADLRERKPFLFGSEPGGAAPAVPFVSVAASSPRVAASSPRVDAPQRADDHVVHAAAEAHATQKPADLMRYLRQRRRFFRRE